MTTLIEEPTIEKKQESSDETFTAIVAIIRGVIAEDWIYEIDMVPTTSFNDDLEMESIEFVALAEKLQSTYGDNVDFVAWLSDHTMDQIIALTVGDLAKYVFDSIQP